MAGSKLRVALGLVVCAAMAAAPPGASGEDLHGGFGGPHFHDGGGYGGHSFGFEPPVIVLPPDYDPPPPRWAPVAQPDDDDFDDAPPRWRRPIHPPKPRPAPVLPTPPVRARPAPAAPVVAAKPPTANKPAPVRASPKPAPPPPPAPPSFGARARLPLAETRYRASEVLVEIPYATPPARIADVLRRHRLVEMDAVDIDLLGLSLRRWRIGDARTAASVVSELGDETALARAQPNYLFKPADEAPARAVEIAAVSPAVAQYALAKMKVAPSLELAGGAPIRVAVIDTAIDESHPDLAAAVDQRFDAIGDGSSVVSTNHGTAMAGGIAANGRLRGVATRVKILSARAFDADGAGGALGATLAIVKGLDWSVKKGAQVVNMSFAGPDDPTLRDALAAASGRGIVLIGAAGNAGPTAPPQYPGADEHVIAATATDADDKLYAGANIGPYVAISAPGVDVLLPASGGGYAMETGTSVSSALVAGVVALMLERQPDLRPPEVRRRLTATATPLGGPNHAREFGAGLVDAEKAVRR